MRTTPGKATARTDAARDRLATLATDERRLWVEAIVGWRSGVEIVEGERPWEASVLQVAAPMAPTVVDWLTDADIDTMIGGLTEA